MGLLSSIQNQAPAPSAPAPAAPAATAAPVSQEPTRPPLPQTGKVYLVNARPARCEGQLGSRTIFRAKDGALLEMPSDPRAVTEADEETVCLFDGRPYVKPEPASERKRVAIVDVPDPVPNLISPPDVPAEVAVQVTVAEATQAGPAPVATAPAEDKPKRGRKPKAEPTAGSTTVDATPTAPAAAPQAPVPESKDPTQLILLVDCSCTAATDLAFYVKKTCDAVAQRFGAPDVRLGHKNSDLGFGGWKALIALEAAQTKPVGICSISSGELADPIIEALAPLATLVVRGRK